MTDRALVATGKAEVAARWNLKVGSPVGGGRGREAVV